MTTNTNYWSKQTVETNRQASTEYFETLRTRKVKTTDGEIKIAMVIENDGHVGYTLEGMKLNASKVGPQRPGELIPVGIHDS